MREERLRQENKLCHWDSLYMIKVLARTLHSKRVLLKDLTFSVATILSLNTCPQCMCPAYPLTVKYRMDSCFKYRMFRGSSLHPQLLPHLRICGNSRASLTMLVQTDQDHLLLANVWRQKIYADRIKGEVGAPEYQILRNTSILKTPKMWRSLSLPNQSD